MNLGTASASISRSLFIISAPNPIIKARPQLRCKPIITKSNFDGKCRALGESQSQTTEPTVYQGVYGPWTIEDADIREVILYRSGLVTAAASFVLASSMALLPNDSVLSNLIGRNLDLFYAIGSCGLGLSLYLIHIYVTEIKRTLQALWLLGALGSLATYFTLAQPADMNLVQYVIENQTAVWFVGPLFAALTGLVFKEGDGKKTSFWNDNWLGHKPIKDIFPDLFSLTSNPTAKVADVWSQHGWNFNFRRRLNDGEIERVAELLQPLEVFQGTNEQRSSTNMEWLQQEHLYS